MPTIPKPLPECSDNYLLWIVVYFAILNVQFNILLFQLKDVTQPMPIYEGSQGDLSRGDPDDPSEFCQRPPESSGRWECPAIRRSVHVKPRCQQTTADPPTMCYLSSITNPTLQFCFGSDSCHTNDRSCSRSNLHEEEPQKTH